MTIASSNIRNKIVDFLLKRCAVFLLVFFAGLPLHSQMAQDTAEKRKPDKFSFLTYVRVISDANKNVRTDQNFIGNLKLCKWLRLEAGFRKGERLRIPTPIIITR